jgi:hypothetical protein
MPKYLDPVNYFVYESDEDPLTMAEMGYAPYSNTIEAIITSVDPVNYQTYIPDPVRAYQPTPTTTSTKVPIKNEYTGEDVIYEIPMGFNPTQYAVNNPNATKETAFQDYLTNPNNKGWGGPTENTFMDRAAGPANVPSEGGFGYIPAFAGDITPDIVEALKSYPQYYDAFDPSKWDVGTYNFITGNTASADPGQGAFDTAAMRNRKTGEWLSFVNAYKMYPHEAQQIWDMYQRTKGRDNWFESDFLQPVLGKVFSSIPTIIGSAAGNYILPGLGGAIGGAIGGVAGNSVAGNPVSWSNWKEQIPAAVAGGVAGYYGGDWGSKLADSYAGDLAGTYLGSTATPLAEDLTGTYLGSTAAPIAEDLTGTYLGSTAPYIPEVASAGVDLGSEAAMFLGSAPQKNPMYDMEKDWLRQKGLIEGVNIANRSSNQIGTDFMNTATGLEQDKAFNMYAAAMEQQRQEMLSMREQEYMNQQRAYEEYINQIIPRMQQAYTYTSPFDYKVPDTSNLMSGETLLTEEDTPNVYYGPETTYRQRQSELARRGIRRGDRSTRAFI